MNLPPSRWVLAALVVLCAVAVHARALPGEFVYDDHRFVDRNPSIERIGNPLRFFSDPRTADPRQPSDIYRPLRTLSFAVERALFGEEPAGFHAVSLALHAANAVLVLLLLLALGLGGGGALLGALLFAVHPVTVEATAWISARADLMAAFFTLLAVLAWIRARGPDRWYGMALAAGILACLSKEAAVVFPGFFLLADLARPGGGVAEARRRWPLLVLPVLAAGFFALRVRGILAEPRDGMVGHIPGWWGGSYATNLALALRAAAYQALFLPFPFVPSQDWYMPLSRSLLEPCVLASGLFLAGLLALACRLLLRGGPAAGRIGTGILWAFLGGLLTSHLLFPVGIPQAERFLYLSLVGAVLAAATLLEGLAAARPRTVAALAAGVVLGWGILSADRVGAWRDEEAVWTEGPSGRYSPRGHAWSLETRNRAFAVVLNQSAAAAARGDLPAGRKLLDEARAGFEAVLEEVLEARRRWVALTDLPPGTRLEARVRRNLARVHFSAGDAGAALREAEASSALDPGDPRSLGLEAVALLELGRLQRAGWRMEQAVAARRRDPGVPEAEPAGVPPRDAAAVLGPVSAWRLGRGYDGAALRALRTSAALYPHPSLNPAVEQVPDLEEKIRGKRALVAAAADGAPSSFGARASRVLYAGMGSGDMEAARSAYRAVFGGEPETAVLRTLWAMATMEADETEEGWRAAEFHHARTLELHPRDAGARLGLARCRISFERYGEAAELLGEVRRDPLAPPAARDEAEALLGLLPR